MLALIIAGMIALLLLVLWMLRAARTKQAEALADRDDALEALDTDRRIVDATRETPPPDSARYWLRKFGSGETNKR